MRMAFIFLKSEKYSKVAFVSDSCDKKDSYTVKEIIELTNGEYGNKTFESFFTK